MIYWLIAAMLAHLGSIASLYPALADQLSGQETLWIFAGLFPLLAVTSHLHGRLRDRESRASGLAVLVVGLGITYLGMTLLAVFDLSFGIVDPFAAREQAEELERLVWYVGFSAIFTIGNSFFIGMPLLAVAGFLLKPLCRLPTLAQYLVLLASGSAAGLLAARLLASEAAARAADTLRAELDANPALIILPAVAVPLVLMLLRTALARR